MYEKDLSQEPSDEVVDILFNLGMPYPSPVNSEVHLPVAKDLTLEEKERLIARYDPEEIKFFELRAGLNGYDIHSLSAIATIFGKSVDEVKEIQASALVHSDFHKIPNVDPSKPPVRKDSDYLEKFQFEQK